MNLHNIIKNNQPKKELIKKIILLLGNNSKPKNPISDDIGVSIIETLKTLPKIEVIALRFGKSD